MKITLQELASSLEGEIIRGEKESVYSGFGALANARDTDICFFGNPKYAEDFEKTQAGVVLVPKDADPSKFRLPKSSSLVGVENPIQAFDVIVRQFAPPKRDFESGIGEGAAIANEGVTFDPGKVSIGPNAVIERNVTIQNGTRIGAGTFVGEGSTIGADCQIAANVSIREGSKIGDRVIIHSGVVAGADGFGFEFQKGHHQKIEQLGTVRIEDDVEIGANTTIDRARFGETVIGEGTKIDNQVQIAHNVVIGKHCLIVAQVGIAGSTRIGDYVTLAAMVGVAGHLTIHDRAIVGGGARVISDLPGDETYFGYPAKPMKEDRREAMRVKQLGRLMDRVKSLEKQIAELS